MPNHLALLSFAINFINYSTIVALKKTCENGEVRLVGGGTLLEGRVEMCYNSRWGTVCDSMWDSRDAGVVCQQISNEYGLDYNSKLTTL